MECNVGRADRIFRFLVGVLIVVLGVYYQSWWGLIGIIPLATSVMGNCPVYTMSGASTCKKE